MCPTNPQEGLKGGKGNERFSRTSLEMKFLGSIDARDGSSELTPHACRLGFHGRVLTLCCMFTRRSLGVGRRYLSSVVPQGLTQEDARC
jgi:hypothetical protein